MAKLKHTDQHIAKKIIEGIDLILDTHLIKYTW